MYSWEVIMEYKGKRYRRIQEDWRFEYAAMKAERALCNELGIGAKDEKPKTVAGGMESACAWNLEHKFKDYGFEEVF